ncbi:ABC transporter permease [Butyrivibrio sp. AE2032]|uniref:ABC transporter permease n=1 Tax=Butyrivibrio sp. AE2032 TaxID=1458463 RepID=UPI0005563514|nr:ABC transporter permease [Butyrivibrio sp. AE2032]
MNSLFFIAKNNIKKHKGEVAIIFALIFIAAVLLFTSLSLILSGSNMIKECDEKYHVADLLVVARITDEDRLDEILDPIEGYEMKESVPLIITGADYCYSDMEPEDAISYGFYIFDSAKPTYLNGYPEEFNDLKDDEITLPYYMSYTVNAGDRFTIKITNKDYEFKVKGFTENLYFATSMNISGFNVLVSHDVFEEISENVDPACNRTAVNFKVKDGVDINEFDRTVQNAFPGDIKFTTTDRPTMNVATTGMSNVACSIILIFTVMLVVMSVIIMHFSIKNFIELNVQNIGLLQATGYTAKELRLACILEQMIIGLFATAAAVIAGIFCSRPLTVLSGTLMGLSGFSGICIPALISTLAGIPVMVLLGSLIATSSYKKLTVLEALRSGITSHNFKKNHFPLESSRLPLSLVMAGKNIFGSGKKSVFITLIVAGLAFSTCLGFTLFQNWALDQSALLKLVGFEAADIQVDAPGNEEFVRDMMADENVEKVNKWSTISSMEVSYLDKSTSLGIDVYSDIGLIENEYVLEGHLPNNGNEIVLTTVEAENIGASLGDIVNVKSLTDDGTVPYTVCGIDQKINNMGKKAVMNEEGAKRLNPDYQFSEVLVYLKDSSRAKELKKQWEKEYTDFQFTLVDDLIGSTISTIKAAMEGICVIFIIATCFVVILTQLLLTRAQVIRERTDLGVSKALGYTSGELIRRTLMTNMPTIALGVILGLLLHIAFANRSILFGLSSFGIRQNDFSTDPKWYAITAAIILICAVITAFLSGRSITKLEPVRILKED